MDKLQKVLEQLPKDSINKDIPQSFSKGLGVKAGALTQSTNYINGIFVLSLLFWATHCSLLMMVYKLQDKLRLFRPIKSTQE